VCGVRGVGAQAIMESILLSSELEVRRKKKGKRERVKHLL